MKDNNERPDRGATPDNRRRRSATTRSTPVADDGRSGYGSDSVRPFLRAQLRQKELLRAPQLGLEFALDKPRKR